MARTRKVTVSTDVHGHTSALRHEARLRGWAVHDFRTGRKAARIAVPSTVAAGLVAGAVTASLAARRRWQTP